VFGASDTVAAKWSLKVGGGRSLVCMCRDNWRTYFPPKDIAQSPVSVSCDCSAETGCTGIIATKGEVR